MERIFCKKVSKQFKRGYKGPKSLLAKLVILFSGIEFKKKTRALKDISLIINRGEIVGIIGSNGSGKTTLLRILAGIYPLYEGTIRTNGRIIPLIDLGVGMKKRLTAKENIFLIATLFGMNKEEIKHNYNSIVKFSGLKEFIETKLYQFSSGMIERLAFAIAIHSNPDILLLDEIFAVGDEKFRYKSAKKIKDLTRNGSSVVFVSHELWMIEKFCNRVIWMDKGVIRKDGSPKEIIAAYKKETNFKSDQIY